MSNDNVKTMVDSLADGDNIAAQDAFKNALFGMNVMVEKKPRRIADIAKVMVGTKPRTLDVMPYSRDHVELVAKEIKANNF